jgi:hypothetical protein
MPSKPSSRKRSGKKMDRRFVQKTAPSVGPEIKFSDSVTSMPGTLNDSYTLLNTISTGTDYNQMIGRRARIVRIEVVGSWQASLQAVFPNVIQPTHLRCVVVYDRQTDGLPIVYTDVFQAGISSSPQDMNTKNRFVVLYDHHSVLTGVCTLAPGGPAAACQTPISNAFIDFKHDCSLDLVKRGVTAAVADIESGSIWVLLHSDTTIAGVNVSPSFTGYSRVYYTDS